MPMSLGKETLHLAHQKSRLIDLQREMKTTEKQLDYDPAPPS